MSFGNLFFKDREGNRERREVFFCFWEWSVLLVSQVGNCCPVLLSAQGVAWSNPPGAAGVPGDARALLQLRFSKHPSWMRVRCVSHACEEEPARC